MEAFFAAMAGEGGALLDAYVAVMMRILGVVAAGFTVQSLLRARTEEAAGRLELVLAAAVGRSRWLLAGVLVAVTGTVGILALTGTAGVLGYGMATGRWSDGLASFLPAALVQVPAALAIGGVVVAAFGGLLELPQPVMDLSPFTHVPAVPLEPLRLLPLVALTTIAAALTVGSPASAGVTS